MTAYEAGSIYIGPRDQRDRCGGCDSYLNGSVHPVKASEKFKAYAKVWSFICDGCFYAMEDAVALKEVAE